MTAFYTKNTRARDAATLFLIAEQSPNENDIAVVSRIIARYDDILGDAVYKATLKQMARILAAIN